ncbi:uncharacterized protein BKCO1_200057 [Diplodia corticola]|uniref:DUF6594 domain-containing protein n=1 Tax=Diplodia corticola TaxID=236234 RepID=A0A1J9SK58_9PEZI|nr:uncharacterized protein BKCO1_200057 [Diplodia corticola]OJD39989.1 hypothetical protein BKCO1_200057 [Diplodia corticola]
MPIDQTNTASVGQGTAVGQGGDAMPELPPDTPPASTLSRAAFSQNDPLPEGYPSISLEMSVYPELGVFRRFGKLNAQSLLYMQAEIQKMEKELNEIQVMNCYGSQEQKWSLRNWSWLGAADDSSREVQLINGIRDRLKEYNNALIRQQKILRMPPPGKRDLSWLQDFLLQQQMTGDDSSIWGDSQRPDKGAKDLVTLLARPDGDPLSTWVSEKAVDHLVRFKWLRSRELQEAWGREGCKEETLRKLTATVTSVVASTLPIVSIVVLYFVQPLGARLGIIGAFNVVLAVSLAVFTKAKRAEVFAVTAAFSAIQVVFVQVGSKGP